MNRFGEAVKTYNTKSVFISKRKDPDDAPYYKLTLRYATEAVLQAMDVLPKCTIPAEDEAGWREISVVSDQTSDDEPLVLKDKVRLAKERVQRAREELQSAEEELASAEREAERDLKRKSKREHGDGPPARRRRLESQVDLDIKSAPIDLTGDD